MNQVREQVEKAEPDLIIEVDSDHFVNFFYNNLPSFCIGMAEEAQGPQEDLVSDAALHRARPRAAGQGAVSIRRARQIRSRRGARVAPRSLAHGAAAFSQSGNAACPSYPSIPTGFASPLPLATRCVALGRMVRRFIDAWEGKERIALIASGCFAMDVGGPLRGWVDTEWAETISKLLVSGQYQTLARRATEERINAAGNNSGELLNWITVAGAVGKTKPLFLEGDEGNGYAVWKFE